MRTKHKLSLLAAALVESLALATATTDARAQEDNSTTSASSGAQAEDIKTRIGTLSFTHDFANGYPTKETVEKLYDERDFQRACQVYLWALPMVSFGEVPGVLME